ncbi:hypothetical protein OG21DRAFT_1527360 [Imleria badia]|nr:hypothetical protein OG21DRAFT_1527360 [Imleria badia]
MRTVHAVSLLSLATPAASMWMLDYSTTLQGCSSTWRDHSRKYMCRNGEKASIICTPASTKQCLDCVRDDDKACNSHQGVLRGPFIGAHVYSLKCQKEDEAQVLMADADVPMINMRYPVKSRFGHGSWSWACEARGGKPDVGWDQLVDAVSVAISGCISSHMHWIDLLLLQIVGINLTDSDQVNNERLKYKKTLTWKYNHEEIDLSMNDMVSSSGTSSATVTVCDAHGRHGPDEIHGDEYDAEGIVAGGVSNLVQDCVPDGPNGEVLPQVDDGVCEIGCRKDGAELDE